MHSQCAGEELEAPEGEVDLSKPSSQNEGLRPNLWAPRPVLLCVLLWCFWMKLNQSAISQPFSSPALRDQLRFPLALGVASALGCRPRDLGQDLRMAPGKREGGSLTIG